jgi:hypothetical protein
VRVEPVIPLDENTLRDQLAQESEKLDGLVAKLRAVDGELDALAGERQKHKLLHEACGALEALAELGGNGLFWGGRADAEAAQHIREVRSRMEGFEKQLGEIEDRREGLLGEIDDQQRSTWFVEDDILEAQEQAARRAEEWVVEREVEAFPAYLPRLPWTRGGEDDRLFRKSLGSSLGVALALSLLAALVALPLPDLAAKPIEPQRLTYLIPPKPRTPPPVAQPQPKLQPKKEVVEKPETPAPKAARKEPTEETPAAPKGILAFREQLAGLTSDKPIARLGSQARIDHAGEGTSGPVERSLVTTRAPGSSGGVNLSALSRGIGGNGGQPLDGVQVARAVSSIGAGGAGGPGRPVGGDGLPPGRTDEEIQIVFDRHKAELYRLYNRELRNDASLRGQMVLRLTIEPDGRVSMCVLHGTDMRAPQLSAQVVERVKTFDFGAKEGITAVTILYPIDFLPAS